MPRFSTAIDVDGKRVEASVPRGTKAWQRANSVFCPLGPAPTQAWLVMTRGALLELNVNEPHTINWSHVETDDAASPTLTNRTLSFPGLYIVTAERLLHGGPGDANALYLVEFADARLLMARKSDTGSLTVNLRSYANAANYLTGTTTNGTWSNLVSALWTACGLLGSFPGLPPSLPIDGAPESSWFVGLNAWRALTAVLDQLDCAINRDPFTDNFTIVQLGESQTIPAGTATLKWNAEPLSPAASRAAETLRIYFHYHRKGYGQERDAELANNWAYNGHSTVSTLSTGVTGASGTLAIWDDLPAIIDESGNQSNGAAQSTRANNRKSRYATRWSVVEQHRIHWGLQTEFVPGGQVRAVLWRNWDDAGNPLGGTVTEFVCRPELVTGFKSGDCGPAWFDPQLAAPERENYAPADLGRHSFPNYPRLPNIVQVNQSGATAGNVVAPDAAAADGTQVHSGLVKRWVNGAMASLDPCWILFVDDYDSKAGNIKVKQLSYYGPARLSGAMTCSGDMRPLYLVRAGKDATANQELVVFELRGTLNMEGAVSAVVCEIDQATHEYVPNENLLITVEDFYRDPGEWQGLQGYRGYGRFREDGRFDVVFMERPALVTEATLTQDLAGSSASGNNFFHYQQGNKTPPSLSLNDPNGFYPFALKGGKSLSVWNDRRQQLEFVVAQQQGLMALATLNATIGRQEVNQLEVEITNFIAITSSPFNLTPDPPPSKCANPLNLWGQPNDLVLLVYDSRVYSDWIIAQVAEPQRLSRLVQVDHPARDFGELVKPTFLVGINPAFFGKTMVPDGLGGVIALGDCYIVASDYPELAITAVAENGRVYGPGTWIGMSGTTPVYAVTLGEQEWEAAGSSDVSKGDGGTFELHNRDGSASGIEVSATCRYNDYKSPKKAIVKMLNGALVANQIECGT